MSRYTSYGQAVPAEPIDWCLARQRDLGTWPWLDERVWLACERISRQGLSTGPGEREGCTALATLDNSPGLVLSDGGPELEQLKDAVDGPELREVYVSELKPNRGRKKKQ